MRIDELGLQELPFFRGLTQAEMKRFIKET